LNLKLDVGHFYTYPGPHIVAPLIDKSGSAKNAVKACETALHGAGIKHIQSTNKEQNFKAGKSTLHVTMIKRRRGGITQHERCIAKGNCKSPF